MTTIDALADANLAQIFKILPSYDRLRASEVCRRWYSISQDPWREVTRLELDTSIPSASIGAIVRKCPNLTSLFCKGRKLILDDLKNITLASLKSVAYQKCRFISHDHSANITALPLFRSEYGQSMEELILHEHNIGVETTLSQRYSQRLLPNSIKRLQLSGLDKDSHRSSAKSAYLSELCKLRSLECLLVNSQDRGSFPTIGFVIDALGSFKFLRELMVSRRSTSCDAAEYIVESAMNHLRKLEILVLPGTIFTPRRWEDSPVFPSLFAKHPSLRILVIPGSVNSQDDEVRVPVRNRFPRGFAADPLPLLHVFVGKSAAELFRFDDSPANWLRGHPINAPFPELLEREEIAATFGDSWIAKQIKEGAKRGINFWRYGNNLVETV